jgi:hypothetical protein
MTFQEDIAELQARIAAARAERDAGQAAGQPQKYFDACCALERLERELEGLRQQGLRAFASHDAIADLGI